MELGGVEGVPAGGVSGLAGGEGGGRRDGLVFRAELGGLQVGGVWIGHDGGGTSSWKFGGKESVRR